MGNEKHLFGRRPSFVTQDEYIIVVDAALRDRNFAGTLKEFSNWICRLSKRLLVQNVLVEVNESYTNKTYLFRNDNGVFSDMFEHPSWFGSGESNWCEFMMWDSAKDSSYPMMLAYKYYSDTDNDEEVERRMKYSRGK